MHFGSKSPAMSFSIGPVNLSISNCERDLGVQIDNKLNFKQHKHNITSKARGAVGQILRLFILRNANVRMPVLNAFVRPIHTRICFTCLEPCFSKIQSINRIGSTSLHKANIRASKCILWTQNSPSGYMRSKCKTKLHGRELFKIIHGLSNCGLAPDFARVVRITRGHQYRLKLLKFRLN